MTPSKRRLDRSPDRRRKQVDLDTLAEAFLAHHRAVGHSPATVTHYADSLALLKRMFAELSIPAEAESLTATTFNRFAAWLRETPTKSWRGKTERSIWGVHGALKDCKAFVRWLVEEEYIDKAPKIPVPKLPQTLFPVLTDTELDAVFRCRELDPKSEIGVRNRALIAFMLETGVRLSEVANLPVDALDIRNGEAKITGKGGKQRMVYFSESVRQALRRWQDIRGETDGPFFWLSFWGVTMLFRRIKAQTGIAHFHAHAVRHTCFTQLVKQGVDLHTIKRIAGHASVTTSEAYLALAGEDIRDKVNTASPFDRVTERLEPTPIRGKRRLKSA